MTIKDSKTDEQRQIYNKTFGVLFLWSDFFLITLYILNWFFFFFLVFDLENLTEVWKSVAMQEAWDIYASSSALELLSGVGGFGVFFFLLVQNIGTKIFVLIFSW